jgi:tetratricopeptide (TPR) repeat protein
LGYFEQAVRADSNLAEAYSGIADNYIAHGLGNMGDFRPDEYFPKARALIRRALALDSLSPEAITSEAKIALFYDFDWDAAARGFSRALALNPHYTNARAYRATLLEFTGRFDAAVTETDAMLEDDPQSNFARLEAARALIFVGRYGQAIAQLRHLLERDSTVYRAHLLLGEALEQTGQPDSAISEMRLATRAAPQSSRTHAFLAHAYALAGRKDEAERELQAMQQRARESYVPAFDLAVACVGLGRKDETFSWLERARAEHSLRPYLLDRTFDPIRSDPRYQQLLREMHLPQAVK